MKKVIKLSESDLKNLVLRALKEAEHEHTRYMFFSNVEQMKRQAERLLELNHDKIHAILENGHDWADDHITVAKENLDQVFDFMMNEIEGNGEELMVAMDMDITEAKKKNRKKTGTPLCARGMAAAKARYDVYPSAYSNGHAVQVCKGEISGLDGKKRCSGAYC
jgi:ABC-type dipeptide/oligopeptide/nickel transport system ATPase component